MSNFVHLHTHSHYSLLDGLGKIPDLVSRAKELGMNALALTDHGSMYGIIEFYKTCKKHEIKPIIGVEVYLAINKMTDKRPRIDDKRYHLVLLAENSEGYKNLLKITSIGHIEGFYYKPRVDKDVLRRYSKGVIAMSACLAGEIPRALRNNDKEKAEALALEYAEIFGKDNFFLELQHHPELQAQLDVNEKIIELARKTGLGLVVTKDIHYVLPEDAEAQDTLLCIQTGKTTDDPTRLTMRNEDYSMTPPDEIARAFAHVPEALENTVKIAERCNIEIQLGKWNFPLFEIPGDHPSGDHPQGEKSPEEYLREESHRRLRELIENPSEEVIKRLNYELDVIIQKGYAAYFLIVSDYVTWSRKQGIVVTTRGSGAGSIVSYAMGIVPVNPLFFNLPFERFLNPYRPSPPDIDVDFADSRRDEAIAYITEKYGKDNVAQICTFGTMLARGSVRDVARALGFPYELGDRISKLIPLGKQGFPMTLARAKKEEPELKKIYDVEPDVKRIIDLAEKIEGCVRHISVHAAGLVISPTRLTDLTPIQREPGGDKIITQYEMHSVEEAGLIKMDILGVRNLSILGNAVQIIKRTKEADIDLQKIPLDDKKTYDLLAKGNTVGVFQLSSSGMTKYIKELGPTSIFDLMVMIALYRPGPIESIPEYIRRKKGLSKIEYLHPKLEPILKNNYGVITYQEDIMEIAIALAGYTWATVDKLRKAIGKKIPEEMAKQEKIFKEGCVRESNLTKEQADRLWNLFRPFQGYGFNRAHAASYAMISYQTAYLKARYPSEFMTAVLTAESGDSDEVARVIGECDNMGITVLPPDVQESRKDFTYIDDKHIRFGLIAIKNLGSDIIETIIEERKQNGKFKDLSDFALRIQSKNFNKKSLEAMIKSGALDSLGERGQMLANTELILEFNREAQKNLDTRQSNLFSLSPQIETMGLRLREAPSAMREDKLRWEKELLGLYVTEHPFSDFTEALQDFIVPCRDISSAKQENVKIGGMINSIKQIYTKKNEPMIFAQIEDMGGQIEVIVFPKVLIKNREIWQENKPVLIIGKVSNKDGEAKIICDKVFSLSLDDIPRLKQNLNVNNNVRTDVRTSACTSVYTPDNANLLFADEKSLNLTIPSPINPDTLDKLKSIFTLHPGEKKVYLLVKNNDGNFKKIETSFLVDGAKSTEEAINRALRL